MTAAELLPTITAGLNGIAAGFLLAGHAYIRRGNMPRHRTLMLAAFGTSALFLMVYVIHHITSQLVTQYPGSGAARTLYLAILISHSVLASTVPILASITLWRGWTMNVEAHRRIARWTWPIWLYVSVTGVIVWLMLYHLHG